MSIIREMVGIVRRRSGYGSFQRKFKVKKLDYNFEPKPENMKRNSRKKTKKNRMKNVKLIWFHTELQKIEISGKREAKLKYRQQETSNLAIKFENHQQNQSFDK